MLLVVAMLRIVTYSQNAFKRGEQDRTKSLIEF